MATISRDTQLDRLHFLVETQRLINGGPADADRVMNVVVQRAQAGSNADGASIELTEGDALVTQVGSGVAEASTGDRVSAEKSLSGQCARLGMPLVCRDSDSDSRVDSEWCMRLGVRSMAVAPLVHSGQSVGVLKVMASTPDHFSEADAQVLELLANYVGPSLADLGSKLEQEAERALRDPLTGLPNKMILMDRLGHAVYEARRYARPFGLFYIDLDHFGKLNDALGRDGGDAVLRAVSRGLSGTVRSGDTLARLEGDQFVILCGNADREIVEERLRTRIDGVIAKVDDEIGLEEFTLRASVGVVWSSGSDASADSLLTAASTAVYRSKRQRYAGTHS